MSGQDLLTASRLSTFRECNRKHDLKYRQGFRPVRDGDALRFGSLIHLGLEAWWKSDRAHRLENALAAVQLESDEIDRIKAEELLIGYDARWGAEIFDEIIAVEEQFEAPLLNPETWQPSRTYRLAGRVDVLVRRNGRVAVLEHKTTSEAIESDADHYWQRLAMDPQLSLYVIGAESLGHAVDECIYDVLKKPSIRLKKATPIEERKFKKDGTLYANQREFDETPEEFRARLRAEIEADPFRYFQRRDVPRMNSQIEAFLFDAWATARNIREQEIAARAPHNPDACWRFGMCPFWNVCANGEDPAASSDFVRVENVHPELLREEEQHESIQTQLP